MKKTNYIHRFCALALSCLLLVSLFPVMQAFALPWGAFCCVRFLSATTHPSLPTSREKIPLTRAYEALAHGYAAISGGPSPLPQNCSIAMLGQSAGRRSSANSAWFLIADYHSW